MKQKMKKFICFWLFILITSCTNGQGKDSTVVMPLDDILLTEINSRVKLSAHANLNTFKIGDTVTIEAENISNQAVLITPEVDIKIYQEATSSKWIEIENGVSYSSMVRRISVKSDDSLGRTVLPIEPVISNTGRPVLLRIVFYAKIFEGDKLTSKKTGSYLDIILSP